MNVTMSKNNINIKNQIQYQKSNSISKNNCNICESAVKNKKIVPLSLSGRKYVTKQLNLLLTSL